MIEDAARRILGASQAELVREFLGLVEHVREDLERDPSERVQPHRARLDAIARAARDADDFGTAGKRKAEVARQAASRAVDLFQTAFAALDAAQTDLEAVRSALAASLVAWHRGAAAALEAIADLDASRRQMLLASEHLAEVQRHVQRGR